MFSVLHYENACEWNEWLTRAGADDVFFSPEYHKANEAILGGRAECVVYREKDFLMLYPYIRRHITDTDWYDITSAYGYGGYIQDPPGVSAAPFHRMFDDYCHSEKIVSEFVRFHPVYDNHLLADDPSLAVVCHQPIVAIDYERPGFSLRQTVTKEVWKKLKKAEHHGLTIIEDTAGTYTAEFIRLYRATMTVKEAPAFYFFEDRFFYVLRELLSGRVVSFVALHEGSVVGGLLVLIGKKCAYNFLSCSEQSCDSLGTNDLLQMTAIEWAHGRGLQAYLLGGGRSGEDSLFRFKAKFSPLRWHYYIGTRIHEPRIYDELCRKAHNGTSVAVHQAQLFPVYRF